MTGSEAAETSTAEDHLPKSAAASLRDKIVERSRRVKAKKKLQRKLFVCLFICLFVYLFFFVYSFVCL